VLLYFSPKQQTVVGEAVGGGGGKKCIRLHNWGRYSGKRSLWIIIAGPRGRARLKRDNGKIPLCE